MLPPLPPAPAPKLKPLAAGAVGAPKLGAGTGAAWLVANEGALVLALAPPNAGKAPLEVAGAPKVILEAPAPPAPN